MVSFVLLYMGSRTWVTEVVSKPQFPVILMAGSGALSALRSNPTQRRWVGTGNLSLLSPALELGPALLMFNQLLGPVKQHVAGSSTANVQPAIGACQAACRVKPTEEPSRRMKWHLTCFQILGSGFL